MAGSSDAAGAGQPVSVAPVLPVNADRVTRFATADLDEAEAFMSRTVIEHRLRLRGGENGFRLQVASWDQQVFRADRVEHTGTAEIHCDPYGDFLIGRIRGGRNRIQSGREDVRLSAGDIFCFPRDRRFLLTSIDRQTDVTVLPADTVRRVAAETGYAAGEPIDTATVADPQWLQHWEATSAYVRQVSATLDLAVYPLVAHELARLLASTALTMFAADRATQTDRRLSTPRTRVTSAAVRRSMAYVDDHAHEPVSVVELAQAAAVSPRALQHAFRTQLDLSPIEYARRVRLERAHQDLVAGDPAEGATVAHIAARWGFVHLGRFAADYQQAYGRTPRSTLRSRVHA